MGSSDVKKKIKENDRLARTADKFQPRPNQRYLLDPEWLALSHRTDFHDPVREAKERARAAQKKPRRR